MKEDALDGRGIRRGKARIGGGGVGAESQGVVGDIHHAESS